MTEYLSVPGGYHLLYNKQLLLQGCSAGYSGYIFNTEAHPIDVGALHCCKRKWDHGASTRWDKGLTGYHGCPARPFHSRLEMYMAEIRH